AGAMAAGLASALAIGWEFAKPKLSTPVTIPAAIGPARSEAIDDHVSELQRKLRDAEQELATFSPNSPSTASPITPAAMGRPTSADCSVEIDRAIADAGQQISQLRANLSAEQAKSNRLAQEFDQQAALVSSTSREKRDAEANLAAITARLTERDRQIKAL